MGKSLVSLIGMFLFMIYPVLQVSKTGDGK